MWYWFSGNIWVVGGKDLDIVRWKIDDFCCLVVKYSQYEGK